MNNEIRKLRQSFGYAISGVKACMKTERNFRIHITAVFYVTIFAALCRLDIIKCAVLCLCFAVMLAAELMNTAIERLCDKQARGYDKTVKQAKDIAAAAVFLCALFCVIIGALFFLPDGKILAAFDVMYNFPPVAVLIFCCIPISIWFVFYYGRK